MGEKNILFQFHFTISLALTLSHTPLLQPYLIRKLIIKTNYTLRVGIERGFMLGSQVCTFILTRYIFGRQNLTLFIKLEVKAELHFLHWPHLQTDSVRFASNVNTIHCRSTPTTGYMHLCGLNNPSQTGIVGGKKQPVVNVQHVVRRPREAHHLLQVTAHVHGRCSKIRNSVL